LSKGNALGKTGRTNVRNRTGEKGYQKTQVALERTGGEKKSGD